MTDPQPDQRPVTTCYRHPDRSAGVSCQRCNRPICPSCMVQASVGFQCPECLKASSRSAPVYSARSLPTEKPYVTYVLIAINLLVFLAEAATAASASSLLYGASGEIAARGVLFGPAVTQGEWWRLITGGFLHAGIIHLGMNMYVLYNIGPQLERMLGPVRYVALYVAALLAGALGALIVSPNSATLGASGAIFGLLGAAAAYQLAQRINIWQSGLGNLILINVVLTFVLGSYISVGGHIGGLLGGGAVGYGMFHLEQRKVSPLLGAALGVAAAVGLLVLAVSVAPVVAPLGRFSR